MLKAKKGKATKASGTEETGKGKEQPEAGVKPEEKSAEDQLDAQTLGGAIDGRRGLAKPSAARLAELFSLTAWFFTQVASSRKLWSMVSGRWVFCVQFRRIFMTLLHVIWLATADLRMGPLADQAAREELTVLLGVAPLIYMDFRVETVGQASASDASEEGSGGCISCSTSTSFRGT